MANEEADGGGHQRLSDAENAKEPPYAVRSSDTLGRYLVASRDLGAGEVVLREAPLAVGPRADAAPLCLGCHRALPLCRGDWHHCNRCGVAPLCAPACESRSGHHTERECAALRSCGVPRGLLDRGQLVLPLRCLLLRDDDDDDDDGGRRRWDAVLAMEAHVERRRGSAAWRGNEAAVTEVLKEVGLVGPDDGELVQRICGVLDVNCFEVRAPGTPQLAESLRLRAIYPRASLMAHDCVGNTHLAVDDNFTLTVHASVPIAQGGTIFFNYTNTLQGTQDRREHLREGKYFECECARCRDPTELGTHLSSLRCHRCRGEGLVTSTGPLDSDSPWQCTNCSSLYHSALVRTTTAHAVDLVETVDREVYLGWTCAGNTRDMEALLSRLNRSFAPNHATLLELKQNLVAAYRDMPSPGRKVLTRKIELCREILKVVRVLEPGISRLAGIALYELHSPLAQMATKHFQGGDINSDGLLVQLREAEACLREALAQLVYEPPSSPEGGLARAAMQELRALRASVQEVEHAQHHASALLAARGQPAHDRRRRKK